MFVNFQLITTFCDFSKFFAVPAQNLFSNNNFPESFFPPLEVTLGTKTETKRIRRGYYRGNNFQDSKKTKRN